MSLPGSPDAAAPPDAVADPVAHRPPPAAIAVVVAVGLLAGAALAVVVPRLGADERPSDEEVLLAVATGYDVDVPQARCVVDELEATDALDDDLARRLVEDAVAGGPAAPRAVVTGAAVTCTARVLGGDLLPALEAAGVPAEVAPCAADTILDGGAEVARAAVAAPLAEGSASRAAVAACALEHLAASLQSGAGIAAVDASCVAADVIERVGLELVLVSIGALAVTPAVADAAAASVTACAEG